ncbi:uncharacterized protein Z519_12361 [Cladophialophora bantiana CBS 173.52]|uniref:Uncharacterized protein n=1 Tax=Cladophialophora bantiana (strain ATCC 10958 / CBS 173.52 / CDC B-1940 / NIH 8579) TaxID=1442370 RepID=A0A0D2HRR4_CLAB1|nr:uncharacterized protein Z519_12361 [Cladophialophora bantiana CBS 173.52]KIW87064.1 hypothetical protein Z519_12361 [Cladophialophora bantiana CBS 173.52]
MSQLYAQFPSATFPIKTAEKQFDFFEPALVRDILSGRWRHWNEISRTDALARICMMEARGISIDTSLFDRAFAIATGNSIFVAESLLSDPSRHLPGYAVRRIVGNLGRPGISILVSPETVMVKEQTRDFRAGEHAPYDNRREDNFRGTSLHLSPAEWKVPIVLASEIVGNIDQDIFRLEAIVSVHDRGRWYGDIDRVSALEARGHLSYTNDGCSCRGRQWRFQAESTGIDNFEELLDPPDTVGIFRAHKNWPARLAATCIATQTVEIASATEQCRHEITAYADDDSEFGPEEGDGEAWEGQSDPKEDDDVFIIID